MASSVLALPIGDTQGKVVAVAVDHNYGKSNSFLIWISDAEADRHNCISTNGYVRVKIDGIGVDETNYQQLFSLALSAQATGKKMALSGASGTAPCENINSGWMLN